MFLPLDPFAFGNTRRRSFSAIITLRRCWRIDVGKQNLLFFLHVHDHLPSDIAERFLNVFNLVMFSSMLFSDPRQTMRGDAGSRPEHTGGVLPAGGFP